MDRVLVHFGPSSKLQRVRVRSNLLTLRKIDIVKIGKLQVAPVEGCVTLEDINPHVSVRDRRALDERAGRSQSSENLCGKHL
jgi:hypothetical protein